MKRFACLLLVLIQTACLHHPMRINPDLATLGAPKTAAKPVPVTLVLTAEQKAKEVISNASAGEKVTYFPYRDLETGLYKILGDHFANVQVATSPAAGQNLSAIPTIETDSSGSSLATWMPTDFTVRIHLVIQDGTGREIWKGTGQGRAQESDQPKEIGSRLLGLGSIAGARALQDLSRQLEQLKL